MIYVYCHVMIAPVKTEDLSTTWSFYNQLLFLLFQVSALLLYSSLRCWELSVSWTTICINFFWLLSLMKLTFFFLICIVWRYHSVLKHSFDEQFWPSFFFSFLFFFSLLTHTAAMSYVALVKCISNSFREVVRNGMPEILKIHE